MITRYISKDKLSALKNGVTPCAAVLYTEENAEPYIKNNTNPKMQLVKVCIMTEEEKSGINL